MLAPPLGLGHHGRGLTLAQGAERRGNFVVTPRWRACWHMTSTIEQVSGRQNHSVDHVLFHQRTSLTIYSIMRCSWSACLLPPWLPSLARQTVAAAEPNCWMAQGFGRYGRLRRRTGGAMPAASLILSFAAGPGRRKPLTFLCPKVA